MESSTSLLISANNEKWDLQFNWNTGHSAWLNWNKYRYGKSEHTQESPGNVAIGKHEEEDEEYEYGNDFITICRVCDK